MMSAEGWAHGLDLYLQFFRSLAQSAEHFYFGRLGEGVESLYSLPSEVRHRVDQLVWDQEGGAGLDATDPSLGPKIAAALMQAMEERMRRGSS